jgi:hypothetical protein
MAVLLTAAATCLIPALILWFAPAVTGPMPIVVSIGAIGLATLFVWFATRQRRSRIVVTSDRVTLDIPVYGRSIMLGRVMPESLTRMTMKDPNGYRLRWRTNGLSVPGYQLGWFRTEGKGRVLAAISGDDFVVCETRDDFGILVSVQDGDGLIAALRERLRN